MRACNHGICCLNILVFGILNHWMNFFSLLIRLHLILSCSLLNLLSNCYLWRISLRDINISNHKTDYLLRFMNISYRHISTMDNISDVWIQNIFIFIVFSIGSIRYVGIIIKLLSYLSNRQSPCIANNDSHLINLWSDLLSWILFGLQCLINEDFVIIYF